MKINEITDLSQYAIEHAYKVIAGSCRSALFLKLFQNRDVSSWKGSTRGRERNDEKKQESSVDFKGKQTGSCEIEQNPKESQRNMRLTIQAVLLVDDLLMSLAAAV
jgi:hypothetical protein